MAKIREHLSVPALLSLNLAEGVFVLPLVGPLACNLVDDVTAVAVTGANTFNYENNEDTTGSSTSSNKYYILLGNKYIDLFDHTHMVFVFFHIWHQTLF